MEPVTRRRAWALLRVVGLVALVGLVLRRVEWGAVAASWRGASAATGACVGAAVVAAMVLRIHKWERLVRALGLVRAPAWGVARGFLLGALLGAVTPLRLGELARVAGACAGEAEGAAGRAAAGVLLEKGHELLVVLATLSLGSVLVGMSVWTCVAIAGATAGVGWLALGPAGARRLRPLAALADAKRRIAGREQARLLALTGAAHGLNLAAGLAIYRAFGELALGDYAARIPVITLINTAPVTVGGFGLRELTAMELFGAIGYPASAAAVAAAALFFAANVLPALVLLPGVSAMARRTGP